MTELVTFGESMVLFYPRFENGIESSQQFTKAIGGAESNIALALARLNHSVRWISQLGADPFGDYILKTLKGEGVDTSFVEQTSDYPTGIYFKEKRPLRNPAVYYYRRDSAASQLSPSDFSDDWIHDTQFVHVTGITPALNEQMFQLTKAVMKRAKELEKRVVFDPNIRFKLWSEKEAKQKLFELLPYCDVFLPGEEELDCLFGSDMSELDLFDSIHDLGIRLIVVKKGAEGAVASFDSKRISAPPYKVEQVIDTVGAGDAFAAGLLHELMKIPFDNLSTDDVRTCLKTATTLGAYATQFSGDWEGAPTQTVLNDLLGESEILDR
ncbi:5-dehydro-2-deoxygluconokinase [Pelagirhabdus alkalitolerans]|uniref:5-dehydro-2-deoxygluconokinase n=1 Tax=Pelagirhabdus alkalitolerans TaxID=1612202 RepID=A0A1G6JUF5_9BACI|nr:sugar kinase [Pelagirhabdus alkalitolerans]SDC21626.1 5-dehydro-2-deoxygluconokinase [Pelagirhabdus alkalitolerans]